MSDFVEQCEDEIQQIITKMQKANVNPEVIEWLFEQTWRNLVVDNKIRDKIIHAKDAESQI